MDSDIQNKIGELGEACKNLSEFAQTKFAELEEKGAATGQTLEKLESMKGDFEKKFVAMEKRVARSHESSDEKKSLEIEMKNVNDVLVSLNRKQDCFESADQFQESKAALDKYIRKGYDVLTDSERKSINGVIDPDGGYLVAPEYSTSMEKRKFDGRAVAMAVTNTTVGSSQWKEPVDDDDYSDASFEDEITAESSDAGNNSFKEVTINVGDAYYPKKFSRSVLEDSFVNLDVEVMDSVRMGIDRDIADGVLNGLGTTESPLRGLLTYANGTSWGQIEQITSTTNDAIDFNDFLDLLPSALSDDYHENASFACQRGTFFDLIVSKDSQNKYQIGNQVQFFSNERIPLFVLGYPVLFDAGMPAVADGALAVAFGDFAAAYRKINRIGFSVHRNESDAKFVTLTGRKRCGGDVKNFRAVKLLAIQ